MSFINSLYLFALIGAALPILIHLIRKMRAKKVKFSSLLFLKATPKELIKKRRLRDLILLIIRTLALALLAFAFARPFISEDRIPFMDEQEYKSVVILVDNSFSVRFDDNFERIKAAAQEALDDAEDRDEYAVVIFNDEAQQVTSLSADIASHRNILENVLKPSYRPTNFYKPVKLAEEILKSAEHRDRRIVFISDFQNIGWTSQFENWNLDPNLTFIPVKIAPELPENSFVFDFNLKKSRFGRENIVEYKAAVRDNSAEKMISDLELWLNDKQLDSQNIQDVQQNQAYFQQREVSEGSYQGFIATEEDKLPMDNKYYFSFDIEPLKSLICIDNGASETFPDIFFFENVFDLGDESLFSFTRGARSDLTRTRLMAHQVMFLPDPRSLAAEQINAITRFVADGGSLIISFGNNFDSDLSAMLLRELNIGRVDRAIECLRENATEAIVGEVDLKHPVFSVFARSGTGEIFLPKFRKYVKVLPDSASKVLGWYDTGDPFLIERQYENGSVMVYTSSFSTSWCDFPIHEVYVPFLYQIAQYASAGEGDRRKYLVGMPVRLSGDAGDEWGISAPGDKEFKVPIDESGFGFFRETEEPGNYIAVSGDKRIAFSVNLDIQESDLETRDVEEAVAAIADLSEEAQLERHAALSVDVEEQEKEQKMWRYIIGFILLLFAFETWLANRKAQFTSV
ncbi:BatA domain-containing protein [candidate division KSB1 bacterium]